MHLTHAGPEPDGGATLDEDVRVRSIEETRSPPSRKRQLGNADASGGTTPPSVARSAPRADAPPQAPEQGPATEAATGDSEARKRARRSERFAPPTPYEIAMAAAATTAARMAAGRAIDWSTRDPPANKQEGASETSAIAAPAHGTLYGGVAKTASLPAPAAKPEATTVPKAGPTTGAEEGIASGTCAFGAPSAGTWASARPMVRARTAHTLASTGTPHIAPEALEQQRSDFFAREAARGAEIRALLVAADPGTGELIAMADKVMTAADYRMELP